MNYTAKERNQNVRKIRDYLAANLPPPRFDMRAYLRTNNAHRSGIVPTDLAVYHECGTSACFAGHGPLAGIAAVPDELWNSYVKRCFTGQNDRVYNWLFSDYWAHYTGHETAEAAIARADVYLQSGVPEDFNGGVGKYIRNVLKQKE